MSLRMPDGDRGQWIAILEAASTHSPDEVSDEWEWLINELGLPLGHFLAVREAIQQGRWRKAKNPKSYVKTVAKREARKMDMISAHPDPLLQLVALQPGDSSPGMGETLAHLDYSATGGDVVQGADGVWRRGGGGEDDEDYAEWKHEFDSPWDYLLSKLPDDLKLAHLPPSDNPAIDDGIKASTDEVQLQMRPAVVPNWKAWAERAGFDEWEQLALEYRVSRKSREKALAEQPDEASRKALQAAWKKVDRTGTKRLGEALRINPVGNVPDDPFSDT